MLLSPTVRHTDTTRDGLGHMRRTFATLRMPDRLTTWHTEREHVTYPCAYVTPAFLEMTLAIKFDQIIQNGQFKDQAELARLGHISRARMTQIMNLLNLAPDIQEELLCMPLNGRGHELKERDLRKVARFAEWGRQRKIWEKSGR